MKKITRLLLSIILLSLVTSMTSCKLIEDLGIKIPQLKKEVAVDVDNDNDVDDDDDNDDDNDDDTESVSVSESEFEFESESEFEYISMYDTIASVEPEAADSLEMVLQERID